MERSTLRRSLIAFVTVIAVGLAAVGIAVAATEEPVELDERLRLINGVIKPGYERLKAEVQAQSPRLV